MTTPVPSWAHFLPVERYDALEAALRAELDRRDDTEGPGLSLDTEGGRLTITGLGPEADAVDLGDLARAVAEHDTELLDAEAIVGAWFVAVLDAPAAAEALLDDPEAARAALRVRLLREQDLEGAPALVRTEAFPGLAAVLLLELETSLATVPAARIDELGAVDDLFARALANVSSLDQPDVGEAAFDDDLRLVTVTSDSPFASCHALWPDRFATIGADGALLAVPTENLVLIHPLVDPAANRALGTLALEARHHHELGPASLSSDLFWWRPGEVEAVPTSFDGTTVHVTPSEALQDILARLAPTDETP
jgi:hypothetical protein